MGADGVLEFKDLIDRLDESVTLHGRDGRFLYLNAAALRPFRRPLEELLGRTPWEVVGSTTRSPFREALEAVIGGSEKRTVRTYTPGLARWYDVDVYPHPEGALVVARDVTERRAQEERLRESEERFRAMVEHAPEAIAIMNLESGHFIDANVEMEKLFGRSRAELLSAGPVAFSPPTQSDGTRTAAAAAKLLATARETGAVDFEWTIHGPRGTLAQIEVRVRVLPSTNPPLARVSMLDITSRKVAQEQLAQVRRLEAVARLAGGVAHDFNNMLTIILGGAQITLAQLSPSHEARDDLLNVIDAAERASLVTRQLLAFARQEEVRPRVLDLSAYVDRMRPLLARLVGEDVQVELDLAHPLSGVLIDPSHVEQILVNLAANGRDAMPKGGRLTIHTANVLLDREYERTHNGVPPGRYVMLTVSDTGDGIPDAVKPHIFEPFFTTKALDRGTGLGLATVHGIVRQNDGHIWVYSEPGLGATFKVYLPAVDEAAADPDADGDRSSSLGGSETVLVVEDEDGVRQVLRRALQRAGYTVIEARNAGEALLICEQHTGSLELLITDVVMPRMTGPQLAARLRSLRPDLRIVFISGYSEERIAQAGPGSEHDGFISKPLSVDALLRGVREVLDKPR